MKKLFDILCGANLFTRTEGKNKRTKIFNLLVNAMTIWGTTVLNIMTCGLYGLALVLIHRRKRA